MQSTVVIVFSHRQRLDLVADVEPDNAAAQSARDWFDETWARLGCEPFRLSGKVLLLDKILGVADSLGYTTLSQDQALAGQFAQQTALALNKPHIKVDLPGRVVGF